MFDNQRYITRGINASLGAALVLFIWALIDEMREQNEHPVDYLQVFDLWPEEDASGSAIQGVMHTQEEPEYQAIYNIYLPDVPPVKAKVFVIDDQTHTTMLLAEEY